MGIVPGSIPEEKFKVGDIVAVRRGKYVGTRFVVVGSGGRMRFFIADGVNYKVDRPKLKNQLHLQSTRINLEDVAGRVAGGKPLDNGWLKQKITAILDTATHLANREVEATAWPKKR